MDSVSDALIRIKNGYLASKREVELKYSRLTLSICQLLEKEGYLQSVGEKDGKIMASLKYEGRSPALTDLKRVSKPGLRVYKGAKFLPRVLNGLGMAIISTPKGVMTDREARKLGVGGEVMAEVW